VVLERRQRQVLRDSRAAELSKAVWPLRFPPHSKVPPKSVDRLSAVSGSCVDSGFYSVRFDIVITALSRCLVLIVTASIFAVTLPTRAEVLKPPRHRMSCCAHMPGEPGHCGGSEPVKSQDRQCCAPCNLCFSLIAVSNYPFLFSPDRGEKLFGEIVASSSRSDRPPVPPPRV
jgi:hypothetical protein